MKKMAMTVMAGALAFLLVPPTVSAADNVQSLRGAQPLDEESVRPGRARPEDIRGGFERDWKEQPPMIPHDISNDRITLQNNSCLKCHSKDNYKEEDAPLAGKEASHFTNRDGEELDHVAQRRWFCNQCHAPQMSSKPLVQNRFEGRK